MGEIHELFSQPRKSLFKICAGVMWLIMYQKLLQPYLKSITGLSYLAMVNEYSNMVAYNLYYIEIEVAFKLRGLVWFPPIHPG